MSHYNEQFLKQNPLAISGVLRDLCAAQVPVLISCGAEQFISRILDVSAGRMIVDFGSQEYQNQAALKAENLLFTAETQGAKVEFSLAKLEAMLYLNLPAFCSPLPPELWFIQRREYFRIHAPLHPGYFCHSRLPDGTPFDFRLCDLSLGGMGALVDGPLPDGLTADMQFSQVEIDLLEWGKFYFDLQLVMLSERTAIGSKNQTVCTPRLSFRFLNVSPRVERELQRIIFSLERSARERADRVK